MKLRGVGLSVCVALLVCLSSGPAPADELARAQRLKVAGIVLTSLGLVMGVTTAALWPFVKFTDGGSQERRQDQLFVGAFSSAVLTMPCFAIGIPLWVVGANKEKAARVPVSSMAIPLVAAAP